MTFSRSYSSPDSGGVARSIQATGGRAGASVSRPGAPTRPAQQQGPQGAGGDIYELLSPSITQGGRRTDKPIELYPTWQRRDETRKVIQQGYALTVNTMAGLGWDERQWLAAGQQMMLASGSLLVHYDDVALPFATENATVDYSPASDLQGGVISTVFKGRAVWGILAGGALFAETSVTDPIPIQILSSYVTPGSRLLGMTVAVIDATECLIVAAGSILYAFSSIEAGGSVHSATASGVVTAAISGGLVQVPLPKQPLLARSGQEFHLIRSDWSVSAPTSLDSTTRTYQVRNTGIFVDVGRLGSRPVQVFWLDSDGKIYTTNVYGTDYQVFEGLGITRIHSAGFVRNALYAYNASRLVMNDGDEWDTGIFTNAEPVSGHFYYLGGVWRVDDTLYADVNLVPNALKESNVSITSSTATTKRAVWRYDWNRRRWAPFSEWTEWTPHTITGGLTGGGVVLGHVTSAPRGRLPFGPSTRRLHIIPGLSQNNTLRTLVPPESTNYYSERGNYALASAGGSPTDLTKVPNVRSAGLVLPYPLTYLDKILDGIETGARDTAGTGGSWYYRWGEHGHLDDTTPGPLTATFKQGLKHADRRIPFPGNQASVLYPQIEAGITRGPTTTATPSILPVTFHFHVDLDDAPIGAPAAWLGIGRSDG